MIYPETRDVFNQDPVRLLRVFEHAQTRGLQLSSELKHLIRRRLWLVNRTFQYARAARETFIAILSRGARSDASCARCTRSICWGAYLPEFGELTCLVQHEFFHRYSADEHTLVCIEKLDALLEPGETKFADYRRLFENLADPFVLYLALLLHDTGKATSARHHAEASALFAQKVAARLQLSPERRRSLILLVDNHITMSSTAQRRNLDDPATITEFAGIVKDRANLDALMLLTLADGQGTSDDAWSDWKESLVWQLYHATARYLAEGEACYLAERRQRENQRAAVAAGLDPSYADEIEAHFQGMPARYFETFEPAAIVEHLRVVRQFPRLPADARPIRRGAGPAISWQPQPERGHTECRVCTWERKGLFARIAGSFAAAGLNILSADIFTRATTWCGGHFPGLRSVAPRGGRAARLRGGRERAAAGAPAGAVRFHAAAAKGAPPPATALAGAGNRLPHAHGRHQRGHGPLYPHRGADARLARAALQSSCAPSGNCGSTSSSRASPPRKARPIDSFYVTDEEGGAHQRLRVAGKNSGHRAAGGDQRRVTRPSQAFCLGSSMTAHGLPMVASLALIPAKKSLA